MANEFEVSEEGEEAGIYIPEEWSQAADTITYDSTTSPPPIVVICGARNCGKTTFSRYLVNTLLQRYKKVCYLDTDAGQTEFTPPGFLSLTLVDAPTPDLAIPCMKKPDRSFFFGDVSSKTDPRAYLKYISTLYTYYLKNYRGFNENNSTIKVGLPLVVNTPGWVKGVGYEVLVDILRCISPTHVVRISVPLEKKNLPSGLFWLNDNEKDADVLLIDMHPGGQDPSNQTVLVKKDARLLRDLRLMAYFRQCLPSNLKVTTIKELAHALCSHPPYQVSVSSIKIMHLHSQVPRSEIFYSLNASIVGLAISSDHSENLPWCVGLGIVRGIDTSKGLIYLITPISPSILENVDLLLQGYIKIPTSLLQVQECISPYMSTNVLSTS